MQEWYLGWEKVSYLERCPQLSGYPYREVPLYICTVYYNSHLPSPTSPMALPLTGVGERGERMLSLLSRPLSNTRVSCNSFAKL